MKLPSFLFISVSAAFAFGIPAVPAAAHGGGLNSEGCHNNRKTGDYHCHRGPKTSVNRSRAAILSSGDVYRNCSEARAAGAAPVHRADRGYARHLDRDNDGIGCE